jgi:hypothetical protein
MSATLRHQAQRLLPIAVAGAALFYVVHQIDLKQLELVMRQAPLGILLLCSAVLTVLNCAADTFAMYHVFRGFGLRLRFGELYTIRAATYTLAVINYHAGQLGIIGFLHRKSKVPLSRASAIILFIVGIWVALLLIFASAGALLGGPKGRSMLPGVVLFVIGLVIYGLLLRWPPRFLRSPPPELVRGHPDPLLIKLQRRAWRISSKLWATLAEAGFYGHLRALVVRLPHLGVLLAWHYLALRCFHIEVPLYIAVLYLPVVFAAASLPISFFGLGPAQMVAPYYFSDYATANGGTAAVFAYSCSMVAISQISNLAMGLLFLRAGTRLGLQSANAEQAAQLDEEAQVEAESLPAAPPSHSAS